MATVKDIPVAVFIPALAAHLKQEFEGKITLPEWQDFVKTSCANEFAPQDPDWYYVRAASLARKVYLRGGAGVGAFSKVYGGNYRRGSRKERFQVACRGLIRKILQNLGELGLVGEKKDAKGRWLTEEGRRVLDTVAKNCAEE